MTAAAQIISFNQPHTPQSTPGIGTDFFNHFRR